MVTTPAPSSKLQYAPCTFDQGNNFMTAGVAISKMQWLRYRYIIDFAYEPASNRNFSFDVADSK